MGLRLTLPEGVQGTFEVRVLYPTDRLDPLPTDVPPLHTAYRRIKGMGLRLASDAWTGAERDAVERGRMAFEDVLTFREDVYDLLRQHTPPKQRRENGLPWAISEDVRKGKYAARGMPKLIENYLRKQLRVPAHYIESMKHIRYLPRKGDCVGRMMGEGETCRRKSGAAKQLRSFVVMKMGISHGSRSTHSPWLLSHMSMPLPKTSAEMSQPSASSESTCAVGSLSSTASSDGPV